MDRARAAGSWGTGVSAASRAAQRGEGAVVGEYGRGGNSAGPVGSGVWAELCLPLTVCVSVCVQGGGG